MARPRETINTNIGKRIKLMRKSKNLTQEEFAKIFKVTTQTVSNWESGRRKVPNCVIQYLSKQLSVSEKFLQDEIDICEMGFLKISELDDKTTNVDLSDIPTDILLLELKRRTEITNYDNL